jgi:hypothetical protein
MRRVLCAALAGAFTAAFLLSLITVSPAAAQTSGPTSDDTVVRGPLPILTRHEDGRVVLRAVRITEPIQVDGQLEETAYAEVPAITDFLQQEPDFGAPISQKTEAWVLYDDSNIYVTCRCWDDDPSKIVANDMRRDSSNLSSHDHFAVQLDTFHDRRNGFMFYTTPVGAMRDAENTDGRANINWNGVWDGRIGRFDGGWTLEMAIPFKSLRYGPQETWGIQLRRMMPGRNERAHLTQLDPTLGSNAINRTADAAILVGLEPPAASRLFEVKPYAISRLTTDVVRAPSVRNDLDGDVGVDVKYALTKSLTADFSYNTDFAQVEADEAQVNLTRFSQSFPEKREFFLEGQGIFQFGQTPGGSAGGGGGAPNIFYSRRIGLSGSSAVPVIAGGRVSGKAGLWSIGALSMETDAVDGTTIEQTNFTVLRARRNILRRSVIGAIYTRRSQSTVADGANDVWGFDGNFSFFQNLSFNGFLAKSRTEGREGDDLSYRTQFSYNADRYGLALDRIVVEENFNPEIGFAPRRDFIRHFAQARFSPRTADHPLVRKWSYQGTFNHLADTSGRLESREISGQFGLDFQNVDTLDMRVERLHEFLPEEFEIADGVVLPVGGYDFNNVVVSYRAGQQHRVSGNASLEVGGFYSGNKTTASFSGRVEVSPRLGVEPNVSINWIDLREGKADTTVLGARTTFTVSPRMFVGALVQFDSANTAVSTNLRFRWEYLPGSELFVVYSEGRSTLPARGTDLQNRGFVVKVNRLLRF